MKIRHCLTFAIFFLGVLFMDVVYGQTPEQIVRQVELNSDEFYYGHGYADNYDQAVQRAKAQLVSSITTYVQSQAIGTVSTHEGVSIQERIHTYTNMTQLRDVYTVALKAEPDDFHVFCYLPRTAVQRMFEERKQKMMNYFEEGLQAEKQVKLTDALQSYYWALLILRTLPDDSHLLFTDDNGQQHNLKKWLNKRIRQMVDAVQFEVAGITSDDDWNVVDVKITYLGVPVANCDYKYWTGLAFSPITRAKDGHGIAEFKEVPKQIQFSVEYIFETESQNLDAELRDIVTNIDKPVFKNTHFAPVSHQTAEKLENPTILPFWDEHPKKDDAFYKDLSQAKIDSCTHIMQEVMKSIKSKNMASASLFFTNDGYEIFNQMMKNGNATIARIPELTFVQTANEIICRSLPMCFKFPRSGKTVMENVVFRFNSNTLKIKSLSFGLGEDARNDILDTNKTWSNRSRVELIRFLEDYQTAYSLKRADFIESIFSDDALIIVGSKLKKSQHQEKEIKLGDPLLYEYTRKTKEEYISSLRKVFASAEFVNLQLKDNQVLKAAGKEIYGIQIRQLYASNSYADQGYLFLIVDLRNADRPIIHVRTWQAEKDPDFGLFDMSRFTGL